MRRTRLVFYSVLLISLLLSSGGNHQTTSVALAQSAEHKPVSLMIVLDNSCSMFPKAMIPVGCTSYGSDINFLRIRGADLFLARLGFGQANEADYRVGVVSLGDEPKLVTPLVPLVNARDSLASKIANPPPEKATQLVPALKLAYQNLRSVANAPAGNLPAVVLITDGVPYPPEGQSNADIEKLIHNNADIPLFIMLLKGVTGNLEDFDQYVKFWQGMQLKYNNLFVSVIDNPDQIEDAYNQIVALLQDTIPTKAIALAPEEATPFYISSYIDQVVITISSQPGGQKAKLSITDPTGKEVQEGEAGVSIFKGRENPVEVISIASPRLAVALRDQDWSIKSDQATTVFIDRNGTYKINFISPATNGTGVSNMYLANESQSPRQAFVVKFNLLTADGTPVLEPQPVGAEGLLPDSSQAQFPLDQNILPDAEGIYTLPFDLPKIYPYVSTQFGRFTFVIRAGSADPNSELPVPIASARLMVDVGPIPFIQLISPAKIECTPGISPKLSVSIGDFQSVEPGSLKLTLSGAGNDIELAGDGGEYRGDITPLCQMLVANLACGDQTPGELALNVQATLKDGYEFVPIVRSIPVVNRGPECTPTAVPGGTPTVGFTFLTPTPLPVLPVDSDQDGILDSMDSCPQQSGWSLFNGCPVPGWLKLAGIALLVVLLFLSVFYLLPWIFLHYISRPPEGFLLVCRHDSASPEIFDLYQTGLRKRTRALKIGGDRKKSHLYIAGLKPVEFKVEQKEDKVMLVDARKGEPRAVFRQLSPESVPTSDPEITLWVATKRSALEKITC